GRIEALIKAGPTSGVVTAFIMQGATPKDELDLEWVGMDAHRVQSMYFVDGQRVAGDELPGYHSAQGATDGFLRYAIEFTPQHVQWFVNGALVRTLPRGTSKPYPAQANTLRMGVWDGSQNSFWAGVVDW
ncbi:glycoside hydrolase, partial [Dimargaris cristalligena]